VSNQNRTGQSCPLCHLRIVLFQLDHAPECPLLTWSQALTLTALRRLARVLLVQLLPVTRGHAPSCGDCGRYNRRRGLNVPPTEPPFRMFHED
jgi:hypothetical protein